MPIVWRLSLFWYPHNSLIFYSCTFPRVQLTFAAWFSSSTLSSTPGFWFPHDSFYWWGFPLRCPHLWVYWHFLANVVFQISPAILTLFNPIFISQTDPIYSLISFIFLYLFYWSIFMSSLNCLNRVIIIHLKSLSKISSMSFLLGVIVIG